MTEHLPPRDRRQRRRILTLRNAAWVIGAVLIIFGGYSLWNELNPRSDDGLALLEERQEKIENDIVREAVPYLAPTESVAEHDPRLPVSAEVSRKDEILGVEEPEPAELLRPSEAARIEPLGMDEDPTPARTFAGSDVPFAAQRSAANKSRVKISGAGNSLTLETSGDGR